MSTLRAARERKDALTVVDAGAKGLGWALTRLDNWINLLTGLGTGRDKSTSSRFSRERRLTWEELESLYTFDDLAATIVEAIVLDSLRQGMKLCCDEEAEQKKDVARKLKELGVLEKVKDAAIWGRLFGGGVILLGVEGGGRPELPLDDTAVANLRFLKVYDARDLTPNTYYQDAENDKFGEVETYFLHPAGQLPVVPQGVQVVHETRLIRFDGENTTNRERVRNQGWTHSILQRIYNVLRSAGVNWESVSGMMQDASQAVMSINGLMEMVAEGNSKLMQDRMALVDMGRASGRMLLLDAENEKFQLAERGFAGVPELLAQTWLRVSAASHIPVTRLMGQAPAGLQATGASDIRAWYDTCASYQTDTLEPPLTRLIRLCAQSLGYDPEGWGLEWPSLWQSTEQEKEELRNKRAQSDKLYVDMMAITPEEVALSRLTGEDGELKADPEPRKAMLEAELTKMAEGPPEPPPAVPPVPGAPPAPGAPPGKPPGPPA